MQTETIRTERDDSGIVTLTIDDPSRSANTMRTQFVDDYIAIAQWLADAVQSEDGLTGVILTSGKKTFFAGGDLDELLAACPDDAEALSARIERMQQAMCAIETLGVPVVAALNGAALGGGLELALACHHRIAVDHRSARFGLPEVTLGLLPGGGGVVRTVRMLGVTTALMQVLLQGPRYAPGKAKAVGLIDAIVPDQDALLPAARAWIAEHPESQQPWRADRYRIPGGGRALARMLPAIPANLKAQLKGAHYDAPHHIVAAAIEGAGLDVDRAFEVERRYFVDLACNSQQANNLTQAFFFDLQAINKGGSRPDGIPPWSASKVAVLGAGMMGAGIAYQCARSGLDVVLKDLTVDAATEGKGYSVKLVDKAVKRGKISQEKGQALLDRIHPTADYADLEGCDLVIEAVFESPGVKAEVFQAAQAVVNPDALLASNTSTLPITQLAEAVDRPDDFLGLHFFSPVDKMPLVEIVKGEKTSDAALAKAIDVVLQIRKTPIVVNDSRGFFTSRVISVFLNEAMAMLAEGHDPVMIERAGLAAGYPSAPLQLMDELTLTLPRKIMAEYQAAAEREGTPFTPHPAAPVLDQMIAADRKGRSTGGGFYDYADGKRTGLWPGLYEMFGIDRDIGLRDDDAALSMEMQERMLIGEAIETVRCFDEGVLMSAADANIGSIFGIGFPRWTGGVAQYIDQYDGGVAGFVARAQELADAYGERFAPPESLVALAKSGGTFRASIEG